MARKILIVGGVAAGGSAAARARRIDENADITVLEKGEFVSYSACGIPYGLSGEVADPDKLVLVRPEGFQRAFRIAVRTSCEAVSIDPKNRTVKAEEVLEGRTIELPYDALVLATGSRPRRPKVEGADLPGVHDMYTLEDLHELLPRARKGKGREVLVVGASYIGLEAAEAFAAAGLKVTMIEASGQAIPAGLDPEMAAPLAAEAGARGVELLTGTPLSGLEAAGGRLRARLGGKESREFDFVVCAAGARPEVALAEGAGVALGETGAIAVDELQRTNVPGIFAAGACCEARHRVSGRPVWIPLAVPANRQGRVAGANAAGREDRFAGVLGTWAVKFFSIAAAGTGLTERQMRAIGREPSVVHLHPFNRPEYMKGQRLYLKVVSEKSTGLLAGAQVLGEGADKAVDTFATALFAGMKAGDLKDLDLAYAPPFSTHRPPPIMAGLVASNAAEGLMDAASPDELQARLKSGPPPIVLDVQQKPSYEKHHIPGAVYIPLEELRARVGELPPGGEIFVICTTGYRSYNAQRMLAQKGFKAKNVTGGMRIWPYAREKKG